MMKIAIYINVAFLAGALALMVAPVLAAEAMEKHVLYQTDFSSDPGWITNSPKNYYWDISNGTYHYRVEGGTGGYTFKELEDYDLESFTLEFDVTPFTTQKESSFRFGVGSVEMDVSRATNVLAEMLNKKYGKLMGLRVITQNNNMAEVTSYFYSYCGDKEGCSTKDFSDGMTYHVIIRYNKDLQNADIKFTDKATGEMAWGYYVNINQELTSLDRLVISSKGEYQLDIAAEGEIDNVELYTFRQRPVTTTPTQPPTTSPTTVTTTVLTASKTTTVPTTTKPTPIGILVPVFASLLGAICTIVISRSHRDE
jgi:hypothetical protein